MSRKTNALITVAALAALAAGAWLASSQQQNKITSDDNKALAQARKNFSPIQGVVLSPARKVAVPALIKDDAKTFTLNDLSGHWSLLYFGYTHCPDICPVTMGVLAQAKKSATAINHIFPQVFFISVDPDRDKVSMLADYVQYFDKDFTGVTGKKDLIKALALQLSVVYLASPTSSAGDASSEGKGYDIDHSSALLLFNPEGRLVAFLNPPHNPGTILKDFQTVVNLEN
jgi:protein SCO1/2